MFVYLVHIPKDSLELLTHCFYFSCIFESLGRGKLFSCMFEDFEAEAEAPVFEGSESEQEDLQAHSTDALSEGAAH
jgi:hypothetical protein